jgi:Rod binding domain-containing protein
MTVAAILPTRPSLAADQPTATTPAPATSGHKIREVARQFEALLVRQMLTAAGVGGKEKDGAYAGMIVDALAQGVTAGRGLGLAQKIADSLAREAHEPASSPASTPVSTPVSTPASTPLKVSPAVPFSSDGTPTGGA